MTPTPEKFCKVLKSIAAGYDSASLEFQALERASFALLFIYTEGLVDAFEQRYSDIGQELDDVQRQHLKSMGIDD